MHTRIMLMILFLMPIFSLLAQCTQPEIQLTETREGNNLTILAEIADPNGLASATLYILEKERGDVVWTEQRIIQGSKASVSFLWPWRNWRISNGTHLIAPALVVKTIDPSAEECARQYLFERGSIGPSAIIIIKILSPGRDSNPRPRPYQGRAMPS